MIAVTGMSRATLLPQAPTVNESGLPGFDVTSWYGVFGPAAMPKDIVVKVNADIAAILAAADLKERLVTLGAEPGSMSTEAFGRYVAQIWADLREEATRGMQDDESRKLRSGGPS